MNLFGRKNLVTTVLVCILAFASRLEAQWQARHGLTPEQYQSTFDDLSKQGYRLKTVSGYVSGGERYAALWVKEPGPGGRRVMDSARPIIRRRLTILPSKGIALHG